MKTWSHSLLARFTLGLLVLSAASLQAADYTIDVAHSAVEFSVRHLVSKTRGKFDQFEGTFSYDPAKPAASKAQAVIKTASVNTSNEKRDAHLRNADFFNSEKFPTMIFTSTKVLPGATAEAFKLEGTLTLLGVSKTVVLDVTSGGVAKDPWGGVRTGFEAKGTLNRKDFGMVWNKALDTGSLMIGEDVQIIINVEGIQNK